MSVLNTSGISETWRAHAQGREGRHLTNPCFSAQIARIGQLSLSPAAATEVRLFSFLLCNKYSPVRYFVILVYSKGKYFMIFYTVCNEKWLSCYRRWFSGMFPFRSQEESMSPDYCISKPCTNLLSTPYDPQPTVLQHTGAPEKPLRSKCAASYIITRH